MTFVMLYNWNMSDTPDNNNNGAIRDDRGRFVPGVIQPGAKIITKETARSLALARAEKYRKAALARVYGEVAAVAADVKTPADAWGFIVARQAVALLDSDKPRLLDTKILGQLLGAVAMDSDRASGDSAGPALAINTEGAQMVSKLLDLVRDMSRGASAGGDSGNDGGVVDGGIVE
jgi:hypothetical protein